MRFIHIADVASRHAAGCGISLERGARGGHLGELPGGSSAWAGREKTDFLLIAGDLFQCQPLLRELKEVNDLLCFHPGDDRRADCRKPRLCEAGELLPRFRLGRQRGNAPGRRSRSVLKSRRRRRRCTDAVTTKKRFWKTGWTACGRREK